MPRLLPLPFRFLSGAEKAPHLTLGIYRRRLRCRRWGRCEHCAKRFLFGTVLAAPSLPPCHRHQWSWSSDQGHLSRFPLLSIQSPWAQEPPSGLRVRRIHSDLTVVHATDIALLPSALLCGPLRARCLLGSVNTGAAISISVSGFPAQRRTAVTRTRQSVDRVIPS